MAKKIFIEEKLNEKVRDKILTSKALEPSLFKEEVSSFFIKIVQDEIYKITTPAQRRCFYFLGSFSRKEPTLQSDLDLLYFGVEDLTLINEELRKIFRSYSLKKVETLEQFFQHSDLKGVLSAWNVSPVFKEANCIKNKMRDQTLLLKKVKLCNFILKENEARRNRYGKIPGKINSHLKNSPGGVIDMYQAEFLSDVNQENIKFKKERNKLYKIRVMHQVYIGSDSVKFKITKQNLEELGFNSQQEALRDIFNIMWTNYNQLEALKGKKKAGFLQEFEKQEIRLSKAEVNEINLELYKLRGLISSPSYHVWDVASHTINALESCGEFINQYEEEFGLTLFEKKSLMLAALFHDLRKGESLRLHADLGSDFVQKFGSKFNWSLKLTRVVSWLVKEHLTLVKHAFKRDPYEEELLQRLALKGCSGRNAIMLFVLSCADIKSTNPSSWNKWKESVLRKVLNRLLGVEERIKENLLSINNSTEVPFRSVLQRLTIKEMSFIPYEVLELELQEKENKCFNVYRHEDKVWLRCYLTNDSENLAEKTMSALVSIGAYTHHAFFKTFKDTGEVYNWFCVETGVTETAFIKRFLNAFQRPFKKNGIESEELSSFKNVKRTFYSDAYAVISFKGKDGRGVLLEAIKILKSRGLIITWGHAVTWGDEIEDVFGVTWSSPVNWDFLRADL